MYFCKLYKNVTMLRTHTCGELNMSNLGQTVTLCGWVQKSRDLGGTTFIDVRDRYGLTQLVFNSDSNDQLRAASRSLGREFVIKVTGTVIERTSKNLKMPTGEIEIAVTDIEILNAAKIPPFMIEDETDGGEELRAKYRYLDLRRNPIRNNLMLRHKMAQETRKYLDGLDFIEVEAPVLIKSTPEGARDFVVPSRMNQGEFYALPQSPQTFKQLLMVSGYDRYYQIVKCFRDEDLRADRQPEFTQVDCEMSFVEQEDILNTFEGLFKHVFKDVKGVEIKEAFPRITWDHAMWHYGNDKPDIRFGMKIQNLKTPFYTSFTEGDKVPFPLFSEKYEMPFKVFEQAETVLAISVPNASEYTRKQLDELTEWVKRPQIGMSGLVYVKCNTDGTYKSSVDKFFTEEKLKEFASFCNAQQGDLILILAGAETRTRKAMSELRLEVGNRLGLRNPAVYKPLWVIDFPLFELDEEHNRWMARHLPF